MLSSVKSVWSCLGRAELRSSSEVAPARQLPDWEMTERRGRAWRLHIQLTPYYLVLLRIF
jgi:hypothetical protein